MYALRHIEPLITLIVLLLSWRARKSHTLWYYLLLSFIVDVTTIVMRRVLLHEHYRVPSSIFVLVEFIYFLYYFYRWKIIGKSFFGALVITGSVLYIVAYFDNAGTATDAVLHSLMFIPPLYISIYAYYKLIQDMDYEVITRISFFWVNTAIFIFTSCAFLLRLSHHQTKNFSIETQKAIYLVFLLFVAIKTVLIGISFRKENPHVK